MLGIAKKYPLLLGAFFILALGGCASSTGSAPPTIPEGQGHLILEAGLINQVNWYVIDQETEDEVHASMLRPNARSPSAYERGYQPNTLHTYLDPGIYTVFVVTDFGEPLEYADIEIRLGEETHVPIRIGKFMLNFTIDGEARQMRFLLWDYSFRHVIGEGMTSTQVRHYITQPGRYKVRIEQLASGLDEQHDVEVSQGRVTPLNINVDTGAGATGGEDGGGDPGP